MSLKMLDLSRDQVEKLASKYGITPVFVGQNPYIASGPDHEILVGKMPNGLYQLELLDKREIEESLQRTIRAFEQYAAGAKD